MSDTAARWLSAPVLFGPIEDGPVRMHWYRAGAVESACGNHKRPLMAIAYASQQCACPRCEETLTWAGEGIPPMPSPPKVSP